MKLSKKLLKSAPVRDLLCFLAYLYIRFVYHTTRWQTVGRKEHFEQWVDTGKPFIYALWHGRLLMPANFASRARDVRVVISSHGDGVAISKVIEHLKVGTIHGSSSKGGVSAMRNALKVLEEGGVVSVTPDGPRGPRMRMGGNIIQMAQKSGVPIIPIAWATSRCKILNSWDHFMLPLPFARGVFIFGEPFRVDAGCNDKEVKKAGIELEKRLNSVTKYADEMMGVTPVEAASEPKK